MWPKREKYCAWTIVEGCGCLGLLAIIIVFGYWCPVIIVCVCCSLCCQHKDVLRYQLDISTILSNLCKHMSSSVDSLCQQDVSNAEVWICRCVVALAMKSVRQQPWVVGGLLCDSDQWDKSLWWCCERRLAIVALVLQKYVSLQATISELSIKATTKCESWLSYLQDVNRDCHGCIREILSVCAVQWLKNADCPVLCLMMMNKLPLTWHIVIRLQEHLTVKVSKQSLFVRIVSGSWGP